MGRVTREEVLLQRKGVNTGRLLFWNVYCMGRVITIRMIMIWEGLLHKDDYDMGRVITQRCL